MTTKKAAEILGVSPSTISTYAGRLNFTKKITAKGANWSKDEVCQIAKTIDSLWGNTQRQDLLESYLKGNTTDLKNISRIQAEHPLIKNPKMFITTWFPEISSYEFLTECNTVKGVSIGD